MFFIRSILQISLLLVFLFFSTIIFGQQTEKSSDPLRAIYPVPGNGPVYVGGVKPITKAQFEKIPYIQLKKKRHQFPVNYSNRNSKYLRPIFMQLGGSCAQASGIGVHLTYALNEARDSDASDTNNNAYPHLYTWNFLNDGVEAGSSFLDGWNLVNDNGIPSIGEYGRQSSFTKWMSGYDKYYNGMENRYVEYSKVDISTPAGIETLKQWLYDYGDGSPVGGCASFSVNCLQPMWNNPMQCLPNGTPEAGTEVVPAWGAKGGHAMVIIGWHDEICYDVNRDGQYTNDIDITMDGIVDVRDWEIGGWYVVNTWGPTWADAGCYYMLYRTGALESGNAYADTNDTGNGIPVVDSLHLNNGGLSSNKHVYTLRGYTVDDAVNRQMLFKITINHDQRDQLSISSGISNVTSDDEPSYRHRHTIFNYQGGPFPMQGENASNQIEIGLDVKDLLNAVDSKEAKYFLVIDSKGGGSGTVESFSLTDYRGTSPVEITCDQTNVAIQSGATILSIVYESAMDPLTITTQDLPGATRDESYTHTLAAQGGVQPYTWTQLQNIYYETDNPNTFPSITSDVSPNDTDDGLAEVDLSFDFPFYGENYRKIYLSTDGNILFSPGFTYVRSPDALKATKAIAALGADLVIGSGDHVYFTSETDKAVIRWQTKHMWQESGIVAIDVDAAVTIHSSGRIEFYYGSGMQGDISGMAVGISNGEGEHLVSDFGTLADIPDNHTFALLPEKELAGMTTNSNGTFSGTPTDQDGTYRVSFSVTDALEITKVKSFSFTIGNITGTGPRVPLLRIPLAITQPISSSMRISFTTTASTHASLALYTIQGKKAATLHDGMLQAGKHTFTWADPHAAQASASGMYLCRLTLGNEVHVKKVALCR